MSTGNPRLSENDTKDLIGKYHAEIVKAVASFNSNAESVRREIRRLDKARKEKIKTARKLAKEKNKAIRSWAKKERGDYDKGSIGMLYAEARAERSYIEVRADEAALEVELAASNVYFEKETAALSIADCDLYQYLYGIFGGYSEIELGMHKGGGKKAGQIKRMWINDVEVKIA